MLQCLSKRNQNFLIEKGYPNGVIDCRESLQKIGLKVASFISRFNPPYFAVPSFKSNITLLTVRRAAYQHVMRNLTIHDFEFFFSTPIPS